MTDVLSNLKSFRLENKLEDASFIVQKPLINVNELENKYDLLLEERKSTDYNFDSKSVLRVLAETEEIDKYAVIDGNALHNDDEILINKGFAKAHSLAIDDNLKINNTNFKIVGYMTTPDYVYPLKSEDDILKNPKAFSIAVVSKGNIEKIGKPLTYYSVKFNKQNMDEFKKNINSDNLLIQWSNKKDNNRISFIDGKINGGVAVGKYMPIAILLLTCVLVSVVISRLIKEEYLVIGTLYAIGYTKKEIMLHYHRYPFAISSIGAAAGTIIGSFLVFNV